MRKCQVRFLGEGRGVIPEPYPTNCGFVGRNGGQLPGFPGKRKNLNKDLTIFRGS